MQPLSYQCAEHSCWVTCMINGIRLVNKTNTIDTRVYKRLHSLLKSDGVPYCTKSERKAFNDVIEDVANRTELRMYNFSKDQVVLGIEGLHFSNQSVVCDVGNGEHSILLHKRKKDWFFGFDPCWYDEERCGNRFLKIPKSEKNINISIHRRHLFSQNVNDDLCSRGLEYHMGKARWRFVTVIEKSR